MKSDLASPEPFIVLQPSGERITTINRGNHLQGWREHNGWTTTKNSEGWWVYAQEPPLNFLFLKTIMIKSGCVYLILAVEWLRA